MEECKITISGGDDEDLFEKMAEVKRWMTVREVDEHHMFKYMVTEGLRNKAKCRYERQYMSDPNSVSDFESLMKFLFRTFNADGLVDDYWRKIMDLKQKDDDDPLTFYQDFVLAVSS